MELFGLLLIAAVIFGLIKGSNRPQPSEKNELQQLEPTQQMVKQVPSQGISLKNTDEYPDGTVVRHKKDGYVGCLDGKTCIKEIFTRNKNCEWQYRIVVNIKEPRKIAPPEDLEVITNISNQKIKQTIEYIIRKIKARDSKACGQDTLVDGYSDKDWPESAAEGAAEGLEYGFVDNDDERMDDE